MTTIEHRFRPFKGDFASLCGVWLPRLLVDNSRVIACAGTHSLAFAHGGLDDLHQRLRVFVKKSLQCSDPGTGQERNLSSPSETDAVRLEELSEALKACVIDRVDGDSLRAPTANRSLLYYRKVRYERHW